MSLVPVTAGAGERLEHRVEEDALVRRHTELGEGLLPWAVGLFVLTVVVWWAYRRAAVSGPAGPQGSRLPVGTVGVPLRIAAVVLAVAVGTGTVVQVYRIGDFGARAVWHDGYTSSGRHTPCVRHPARALPGTHFVAGV
ncbi:hypothetical protein, partial [Streptomyces antibioticus]|uniref:hypothetical protein n=1 Tax=Streptomyces antibioticus TaxID=1890 RepID=UPI0033E22CCB